MLTEEEKKDLVIRAGEKIIQEQGHGVVPGVDRNSLTGLRYVPIIEAQIGRRITDKEWEDLSIR
ncbi:MAG: hypothetical protein FWF59_12210 [Turicibacter sp.]|nr:hypothetical protein [Turicibacter sp.]